MKHGRRRKQTQDECNTTTGVPWLGYQQTAQDAADAQNATVDQNKDGRS
jgi:hypothetical protein